MKRKLFMATLICCLFCFGFIGIVNAKNGPSNIGELNVADYYVEDDYHSHYLYNPGGSEPLDPLEGTSYDVETNTLTLNNVKGPYEIRISLMGEDFKINVVGYNEIRNIASYADKNYITNVNIIGDGTLIINKDLNDKDEPIYIYNGNLVVGENVNLTMYAPETSEDDDYEPLLVEVYNDFDTENPIVIKNDEEVEVVNNSEKKKVHGIAFIKDPDDTPYTAKIVTKDEKKYVLEEVEDEKSNSVFYYVSKRELLKYGDYYFLDISTVEDSDNLEEFAYKFSSPSDVTTVGGYTDNGETINVDYRTYLEFDFYVFEDSDGNKYAVYEDDDRFVFDFTDDTITLANTEQYTFLKVNEDYNVEDYFYYVNGDKLKLVYDAYVYNVEGTKYTVNALKEETNKNNNPKTGDNLIEYISILIISTYILIKRKA